MDKLSTNSKTVMIALSDILVPIGPGARLRKLRPDVVDAIAESMKTRGQLQNIVVCPIDDDLYRLVAGYHRLEAAKKLKWDAIRCTILDYDDVGGYGCCHHPDDNRPSRSGTHADHEAGGHARSRPEHGDAIRLCEQGKA